MLKARTLKPGGTIGVPAPASPYHNRSDVLRGVEWWESRGYRVKLAKGIYERDAYVAGDAEQRARDINEMFADDEVDVVQCFQGGYGSAQTLPHIDFDSIASNPKPFIGYSDITSLHSAIRKETGLVTFYGPGLAGVNHAEVKQLTQEQLLKALTTVEPLGAVPRNPDDDYIRTFVPGVVTAPMVGGCLWLLGQAMGTPWQIELAGRIFFFEDVDAPPWYIDGILTQMALGGVLEGVVGVVVGELKGCDWSEERPEYPQTLSIEDVMERHIQPLGVPTIYGLPMGHGKSIATTPMGVDVTLDADVRTLRIDEPALVE
jgi:muramoyltetrapeptide carboxypeptidase